MKQIDIIKTYAQKRCLIVDDSPPARTNLNRLLVDFGVEDIDTAGTAEEAIDLCERQQYNIVISDYSLGNGKNGQQLLEELRYQQLLKHTAIFVIITAESSSQFVLHALENEPDDLLQKPINKQTLRPRLDAALLKNEYLFDIKSELDSNHLEKAIQIAEQLANEDSRFQTDVKKILAELYISAKAPEKAQPIYASICGQNSRTPLWARIGKAHIDYLQKHYEDAEAELIDIIEENHRCVDAMDLLAQVYRETNRPEQAQHALLTAVKVSPRTPTRQRELARVSDDIEDENTAVTALRSAIRHAKNSCHEASDDHVKLADSLIRLAKKVDADSAKVMIDEARGHLETSHKRYEKQPIVKMRSHLVEAELQAQLGDDDKENDEVKAAIAVHKNLRYGAIAGSSIQLCIDCAKAFMARGCSDEGEAILQELARINSDAHYATAIDKLLREPKTKEGIGYAAACNREGISYYEKNQLDEALSTFKTVIRELPNHIGLNLNVIQVLISKHKSQELSESDRNLLNLCFQRLGAITRESSYYKRYHYLKKRFDNIDASSETDDTG